MHFFPSQSIPYPNNNGAMTTTRGNHMEHEAIHNNAHSLSMDYNSLSRCNMYNSPAKLMKLEPTTPSDYLPSQLQHSPSSVPSSHNMSMPPPPAHSNGTFYMPPRENTFPFMPPHFSVPHLPNSASSSRFFSPQRPTSVITPKLEKYMHSSFPLRQTSMPPLPNHPMSHAIAGDSLTHTDVIHSNRYYNNGAFIGDLKEPLHTVSSNSVESKMSISGGDDSNSSNMQQQLDPLPSGNGVDMMEQPIRTHRIGRRCKPKEDRRCGVCGDKALSCNFDALTCESCKAFFRRNASKDVNSFKCPYKGMCNITVGTRRLCKQCRIRRCFDIGMKKEYILSMEERSEKQQKIRQNKIIKKLEERNWIAKDLSMTELATKRLLTEGEIHLIDEVVEAYNASLWVKLEKRAGSRDTPSIADLVNLAEISIRRAIEMFKRIKAFRNLDKKAQVVLLKSGCIELLVIRGVLSYDPLKRRFLDSADNETSDSMSLESVMLGAGGEAGSAFKRLIQTLLIRTQCCNVTMLLLLIICLFSNRGEFLPSRSSLAPPPPPSSSSAPTVDKTDEVSLNSSTNVSKVSGHSGNERTDLQIQEEVENLQLMYSHLLKNYLATKWSIRESERLFPQVMIALSDLCTINEQFSRQMMNMNVNNVTPLMTEMLDIPLSLSPRASHSGDNKGDSESRTTTRTSRTSTSASTSCSARGGGSFRNPTSSVLNHQTSVTTMSSDTGVPVGGQNDINQQVASVGWTPSSVDYNDSLADPSVGSVYHPQ